MSRRCSHEHLCFGFAINDPSAIDRRKLRTGLDRNDRLPACQRRQVREQRIKQALPGLIEEAYLVLQTLLKAQPDVHELARIDADMLQGNATVVGVPPSLISRHSASCNNSSMASAISGSTPAIS